MALPQVVVVEDDAATRRALGRLLRAGGFESCLYGSAEEFLAEPPRSPVCLVLDVGLGAMSGLDLLRLLRSRGSAVPVIIMSALDDSAALAEAQALGCLGYLLKDTDGDVLLAMLRRVVAAAARGPHHRN